MHRNAYNIPPTKVEYGQEFIELTKHFLCHDLIGKLWDICFAYLWQNGYKILEHILFLIFYALSSFSSRLGYCKHPLCYKHGFREMCRNYRFGPMLFFIKLVMLINGMARQKTAVTLVSLGQVTRAWGRYILNSSIYSYVVEDTTGLDYQANSAKINVSWQFFSNMASDWLMAMLPAIQRPGLKILFD